VSLPNHDASNLRFSNVDSNSRYKLPADPWVLRVRWKKDGKPSEIPRRFIRSFSVDLRRQSVTSLSTAGGSLPSELASPPGSASLRPELSDGVIMHLDIQLYEMEPGVYLVDFKCAGYETPDGMLLEEKDITSPFPFLDLASKLIIQLAEAD
jgi:carbon catabolite-derepressing protein kinase